MTGYTLIYEIIASAQHRKCKEIYGQLPSMANIMCPLYKGNFLLENDIRGLYGDPARTYIVAGTSLYRYL